MPSLVRSFIYISLLVSPLPSSADTDISGIKLADGINLGNEVLALNGAGLLGI